MLLKTQSSQIPQNPGVYFFKKSRKILYIGKATNLRSRIRFYFNLMDVGRPEGRPTSKSSALLKEATKLNWEVLGSETEALIREAELIKKYRPKYNVLMRDDKNYFYAGFTKEIFPRIFITHQPALSHKPYGIQRTAEYIGPFTEGGALRSVLKTLRRAFPYCTCKQFHKRPCLNSKIGRCLGFCCLEKHEQPPKFLGSFSLRQRGAPRIARTFRSDAASDTMPKSPQNPPRNSAVAHDTSLITENHDWRAIYQKNISAIKQILSGKNQSLTRSLKKEMKKLSNEQKYEEAGRLRDKIRALARIFQHRNVIRKDMPTESNRAIKELETLLKMQEIQRIEAYDIANIHGKFAYGSMAVFENGALKKEDYRLFKINTVTGSDDARMIAEIISRRFKHPEWPYPQVIIVDGGKQQLNQANMRVLAKSGAEAKRFRPKIIAFTKNSRHIGDHIFIERTKNPMPLSKLPESLKNLILSLDSEAHRFAIAHYRKAHRKNLMLFVFSTNNRIKNNSKG